MLEWSSQKTQARLIANKGIEAEGSGSSVRKYYCLQKQTSESGVARKKSLQKPARQQYTKKTAGITRGKTSTTGLTVDLTGASEHGITTSELEKKSSLSDKTDMDYCL